MRLISSSSSPALPLEGFAAAATGGTGGTVYAVINNLDTGAGSLRQAIADANADAGAAIVDIQVGGFIPIDSTIVVDGDDITITAINAPSVVILRDMAEQNSSLLNLNGCDNVVMEYIRMHRNLGDPTSSNNKNIVIGGTNIYIRHCVFAWADDEPFTIWSNAQNITLQYCMIYEGLHNAHHSEDGGATFKGHSKTMIVGTAPANRPGPAVRLTIVDCILMHGWERQPVLSHQADVELINCIVYNWGNTLNGGNIEGYNDTTIPHNIRGNIFMNGFDEADSHPLKVVADDPSTEYAYFDDNLWQKADFTEVTVQDDIIRVGQANLSDTPMVFAPVPAVAVTVLPRQNVWAHLRPRVGAILPARSSSDIRVLTQIDKAINQVSITGQIVDTPTDEDTNQNPAASVTVYSTWSEVL